MQAVIFLLRFVLALVLGSTVAALISVATTSPENATPLVVAGIAGVYAIFGIVPAAVVGLPMLKVFRRLNIGSSAAALLLTLGGAAVGALLMTATFTSFATWGAIAGASIGLVQGCLLHKHAAASATSDKF